MRGGRDGGQTGGRKGGEGGITEVKPRRDDRSKQVAEVTLFGFSILPCGKLIAFRIADN